MMVWNAIAAALAFNAFLVLGIGWVRALFWIASEPWTLFGFAGLGLLAAAAIYESSDG